MKKALATITKTNNLGFHELALRVFAGATMIYHGQGKLFNLEGTTAFFAKVGIEPAGLMAVLASLGETLGGLALIIGLFARLGAAANAVSMLVAIVFLGIPNGFDVRQGGFEYQATLMLVFLFFTINGAGKYSLDKKLTEILGR